jgi:hypothetical protein
MVAAFNLKPFVNVEKIALFKDGPNFYYGARALGLDVDFKRAAGSGPRSDANLCKVRNSHQAILARE